MSITKATLYIVATPIGNLGDITERAIEILKSVDVIAAENPKHSARLFSHFNIGTPCISLHEHNERETMDDIINRLSRGQAVALISDAGTPLISDPGFPLVRKCLEHGYQPVPVPGPCALISALSVSGLPSDRFVFEGFLPAKSVARKQRLDSLRDEARTLVFYEAPHRIVQSLNDMVEVFGPARHAAIARELTKVFETVRLAPLGDLVEWIQKNKEQQKGEIVLLIGGAAAARITASDTELLRMIEILSEWHPLRESTRIIEKMTGVKRNRLYELAIRFKNDL